MTTSEGPRSSRRTRSASLPGRSDPSLLLRHMPDGMLGRAMDGVPPPPEIPPPPASTLGAEAAAPKRRRVAVWIGIAAAVVVAAVAVGALLNRSSVRFPD